jgi:hypothetical protein
VVTGDWGLADRYGDLTMSDRFQCEECAAEFATESEMLRHVTEPHVRAKSGKKERMATPANMERVTSRTTTNREGREFTRRNPE